MAIYKRGPVWWMSFTYQGKQIRRSTETNDRKLAQRIFDKLKGEIAEGKYFEKLPGEDYTLKDMMAAVHVRIFCNQQGTSIT